jgi:hypothetical protein
VQLKEIITPTIEQQEVVTQSTRLVEVVTGEGEEPGKGEVKTTWLWLRGLRPLVPTTPHEPGRIQACWLMGPSDTRAEDRARTYSGIGKAMAAQFVAQIMEERKAA